jgi:CpXC protein
MMAKTRMTCPNCRQPIVADIEQLFDAGNDPSAKQRLLSGAINAFQCPNCGFTGNLATPVVYHDPDKELLITFVPPEVGLPRNEQEKLIGSLINQVVSGLPQEKRKAYLLQPKQALTMQGLIESVLQADGITHEMIQSQQVRLKLIERLANASADVIEEVVKQENQNMDAEFFAILRRLIEASLMAGDQDSAQRLAQLQQTLLPLTTVGRELQDQAKEIETALSDLQKVGRELNREKLLDFIISAPNEVRLKAYVSFARPLMDYSFFQLLSERIDRARPDGRARLASLRDNLLAWTQEVDRQTEARAKQSRDLLQEVLQAEDIGEATMSVLPAIDEYFLQELKQVQDAARKQGDLDRLGKIQKVMDVIQQANSEPPEIALIEELLDAPDDASMRQKLGEHIEEITPDFLNALGNIAGQIDSSGDQDLISKIHSLNRMALRVSMEKNLRA